MNQLTMDDRSPVLEPQSEDTLTSIFRGVFSGLIATGSMTSLMMDLQSRMPAREKSPLPPASIANDLRAKAGFPPPTVEGSELLGVAAHFAYGAILGGIYGATVSRVRTLWSVKGLGYGAFVWGANYLGLLPILGVRAQARNMPPKRNAMMILAHLVWGITLAHTDQKLKKGGDAMWDGQQKASAAE
jgi:putative membrane protein